MVSQPDSPYAQIYKNIAGRVWKQLTGLDITASGLPGAVLDLIEGVIDDRWQDGVGAIVALQPVDMAEARYQLALAHFEAGDVTSARREVLRALENAPNFERAQELLLRITERKP